MAATDGYVLSSEQAAEYLTGHGLPCVDETVRRWAKAGKLPRLRTPGGRFRYREADLLALIESLLPDPEQAAS